MKQILALLLAAVMSLTLFTACGKKQMDNNQNSTPPANQNPSNSIMDEVENMTDEMMGSGSDTNSENSNSNEQNNSSMNNGSDNNSMEKNKLKSDATLESIVMKLGEELGINMPKKLDEETLKNVFAIQPEWVEEYYGEYSAANTSADHLLAFKVKEGHIEDVKKALEQRRESIIKGFENSLLKELEKARNSTIVEKGNYLFFVIAGDSAEQSDKDVNRAKEIIESYFE